ncbi:hypothetical protein IWX90DRAFT_13059 [Phyllosticta citrichinensis]|uniref:Uncharacterized protein n=1 Tax=Phyllosticta citrichinensis TaxID=1130410 RepID=A0ABR1Y665_9PEZI
MNFSNRSQKLWTMALILALVVFLLLCNIRPEQLEQTLHKRGDPEGEADGHNKDTKADHGAWKDLWGSMPEKLKHTLHKRGDKDDDDNGDDAHNTLENGWGAVPEDLNDQRETAKRKIPGPKTEPPFEPCNRKDWVMWLSFGAPHEEFWSHRDARDVSCLKDADWKSDACTGFIDRPGTFFLEQFDFKIGCQRRDFARLNLPDFRNAFREEMGSMISFEPFIKERFAKDLTHMCNKEHYVKELKDSLWGDVASESKKRCNAFARFYINWNKS